MKIGHTIFLMMTSLSFHFSFCVFNLLLRILRAGGWRNQPYPRGSDDSKHRFILFTRCFYFSSFFQDFLIFPFAFQPFYFYVK